MKKIIVKFQGGLGNQLYDYAFYKWLRKEYPEYEVLADLTYYKIRTAHGELGIWKIFPRLYLQVASNWEVFKYSGQIPIVYGHKGADRLNSIRIAINNILFTKRKNLYISKVSNDTCDNVRSAIKNEQIFLEGYWQNIDFIKDSLCQIRADLKFSEECNKFITSDMLLDNAVALHVRRGDYVGSKYEKEVGMSYYKKAIQLVQEKVPNAKFFIFSDDKEYVKKAFDWLKNKTIVVGYDNELAHIDMFLMSKMRNMIIANSTFSLWSAYLNENRDLLVVYPNVKTLDRKTFTTWIGV